MICRHWSAKGLAWASKQFRHVEKLLEHTNLPSTYMTRYGIVDPSDDRLHAGASFIFEDHVETIEKSIRTNFGATDTFPIDKAMFNL